MEALCSARMFKPFLNFIADRTAYHDLVPPALSSADLDHRAPVELVHGMFENAVERFGDEQLGLKVGASMSLGQIGPIDYLLRSAATMRDSIEAAGRYSRLHADGYRVLFERWRGRAIVRLVDEISWPRAVADLAISTSYKLHVSERAASRGGVECWFPYSTPRDLSLYEKVFEGATLRFGAPFFGFAYDRGCEDVAQPGADPVLHAILRERLDAYVGRVDRSFTFRARVQREIEAQLRRTNDATAPRVASALHMSRRTLTRKLEREGTTFVGELDRIRKEIALEYLRDPQRPLAEVAFKLGYTRVESFHRAFKRWTGGTPSGFR